MSDDDDTVSATAGYFLIALSADEVPSNETRLKGGGWFDLPMVYEDGRRAILAIEKGPPGEHVFEEVFGSWSSDPDAHR